MSKRATVVVPMMTPADIQKADELAGEVTERISRHRHEMGMVPVNKLMLHRLEREILERCGPLAGAYQHAKSSFETTRNVVNVTLKAGIAAGWDNQKEPMHEWLAKVMPVLDQLRVAAQALVESIPATACTAEVSMEKVTPVMFALQALRELGFRGSTHG